jgi:hypothetical protein
MNDFFGSSIVNQSSSPKGVFLEKVDLKNEESHLNSSN